jgi:hypothetical protein
MRSTAKLIPAGLSFERALALGYTGRIRCEPYLSWLRTLPCDSCGAPPPSEASHINNDHKGHGTKAPDLWAIPECHQCHERYERLLSGFPHSIYREPKAAIYAENDRRKARAALYLLQAFFEGRLAWKG